MHYQPQSPPTQGKCSTLPCPTSRLPSVQPSNMPAHLAVDEGVVVGHHLDIVAQQRGTAHLRSVGFGTEITTAALPPGYPASASGSTGKHMPSRANTSTQEESSEGPLGRAARNPTQPHGTYQTPDAAETCGQGRRPKVNNRAHCHGSSIIPYPGPREPRVAETHARQPGPQHRNPPVHVPLIPSLTLAMVFACQVIQ